MAPRSARLGSLHLVWVWTGLTMALPALGVVVPAGAAPTLPDAEPARETSAVAVARLPTDHALAQRDKVLSAAARTAVNYVDAAARLLAAGDAAQAGRLLAHARRLMDQIRKGVRERGAAGSVSVIPVLARVRLGDGGEVGDALVARVQALEPQVLAGDHDRVLAGLLDIGIGLTYEYVGMPVQAASDGIDRASAALAAGETDAAEAALLAIVHGLEVRTLSIGAGVPSQGQNGSPGSR